VTAECSQEYIGNPSVVTCTEEDSTYKLKGCEKKVFCFAPTVLGYHVDENSLVMQAFDVTAKCADGFHGTAKVTPCSKEGEYSITGCTENLCTAPSTVGYAVKEVELREHSFKVTATCDTGYDGTAVVEPCKIHKGQYVLKGCTRDEVFCVAPTVTDGYDVTETDLRVDEFEVKASCAPGYTGSAMVTKCSGATDKVATSYTLDGCTSTSKRAPNQKIFCVAPAVTDGYDVTETDLREHVFQVTARCSAGYSGTAKVYRCTGSTEEVATSYTLSGCTRR